MDILTSKADGILTIAFNRPERKNAITGAMYQTMADALVDADTDNAVRAIVFFGRPEIFTAGNDLEDFLKNAPVGGTADAARPVYQFMRALAGSSKPVIAAVSGAAIGIGTTMLLHCDMVYAADNAKFCMPFVQLGLCPEFASSVLFPAVAGYPRAAEKLLLGESFSAQEAFEMGMLSKVLPLDELQPYALRQAAKLVALPAASVRATKALMKQPKQAGIETAIGAEIELFSAMLRAPEAKEAFTAFFEKRKPDFSKFA
ncbi:enoyl-CoA hydratase [Massilia sp. DWR3-1-1]|uniref:enoyl-CoA hydratase n=1 Tax=Massilia sp. DWR3-1-1 TaxID=2804559 RepID=UPI003CEB7CD7